MTKLNYIIREIKVCDNEQMKNIVQHVILEVGAPKVGTAYEDTTLEDMYGTYQKDRAIYYVIEYNGKVFGGAGIAQLDNLERRTCELQKMYFLDEIRGKGLGEKIISKCINKAREYGFEQCYLETMPCMVAAQKLYIKNGFKHINRPMGNTRHYSCDIWMIRKL